MPGERLVTAAGIRSSRSLPMPKWTGAPAAAARARRGPVPKAGSTRPEIADSPFRIEDRSRALVVWAIYLACSIGSWHSLRSLSARKHCFVARFAGNEIDRGVLPVAAAPPGAVEILLANTDKVEMPKSGTDRPRWLVRIRPLAQSSIADLLRLPVSLDVWQRDSDGLVAAASEESLDEIERRKLARVERICSVADYVKRGWPNR
jgi:hypothetical protein